MKWEQLFPTVRGFHPATGQRVMQENIADWVTEAIEARVANRMAQCEKSIRDEANMVLKATHENHDTELDDFRALVTNQEKLLETQTELSDKRLELLLTAEETINTLKEKIVALENVAQKARIEELKAELPAEDDDRSES